MIKQNRQFPRTHFREHPLENNQLSQLFSVDQCHCSLFTVRLINVNVSTASKWSDQLLRRLDRLIWWPEEKNWPARFVHIHNYHLRLFYSKIFFASLQIPNHNFCLLLVLCHVVDHNGCNVGSPPLSTALQLFWISKFPSTTLRAPGCAMRNAPWTLFVQLVQHVQHVQHVQLVEVVPALNMLWASDREGRVPFVTECVTKNDDVTIVREVASVIIMSLPALPIHSLAL